MQLFYLSDEQNISSCWISYFLKIRNQRTKLTVGVTLTLINNVPHPCICLSVDRNYIIRPLTELDIWLVKYHYIFPDQNIRYRWFLIIYIHVDISNVPDRYLENLCLIVIEEQSTCLAEYAIFLNSTKLNWVKSLGSAHFNEI